MSVTVLARLLVLAAFPWPPLGGNSDVVEGPRVKLEAFPRAELAPVTSLRLHDPLHAGVFTEEEWTQGVRRALVEDRTRRRRTVLTESSRPSGVGIQDGQDPLTDIGLEVNAHLEMRVDQLRNARCEDVVVIDPASGCAVGFPTPTFDQQFRVRAGGVVSDRVHVNVDFDSQREFSVNNDIGAWYLGQDGEFLQRVDVGNVTFRAPQSRYVGPGLLPSNAFGVQAQVQAGALELAVVAAQQRGSTQRSRTFILGGDGATQPVHVEARDLDYESGRFFSVVDPARLPGYPALDLLNLGATIIPPDLEPVAVRVYRLRAQGGPGQENVNLGGVDAVAIRDDAPQRVGPFPWELLVEGRDYYLDPSGLWFALATRLGTQDFLAVSFITAIGDTVGTFPSVDAAGSDTLFLIHEPQRGPAVPTFRHELRNVYRVGGADVVRASIDLDLLVNESEQPLDGTGTYLRRLDIAESADPSDLDTYNRVFPRERDPGSGEPLRDVFVVFPHLQPFADSTRLQAGERNDSLYRTPTYLLRTQGPPARFSLRFDYEASGSGDRSTVSLGALQVREGSERLFIGDRELRRGQDYEMDYALGQIRFLEPEILFAGPTTVRAEFQENQLFDPARKNLLGVAGTYHIGSNAKLEMIGLFQSDRTSFTRPLLGLEPQSGFVGALRAEWGGQLGGITRALNALPFIDTDAPSSVAISGELALSQPNPNRFGVAYVEDFEGSAALTVNLREREFQLGSAPTDGRGLSAEYLGFGDAFGGDAAVPLVWQNAVSTATGVLEFSPRDIDSSIVLTGAGLSVEPVLWLTLKPDTVGGAPDPATGKARWRVPHTPGPRWRSVTQTLGGGSGVGADLSRVESLEFWVLEDADRVAVRNDAVLVFDFGTVLEDVPASIPERFQVVGADTVFEGSRPKGAGSLDTERDSITNIFNALVDDRGILGDIADSILDLSTGMVVRGLPLCDLQTLFGLEAFPRGSLRAACTRRNGRLDTEDLDGDNRLDETVGAATEHVFRYIHRFGDTQYYVRDGATRLDDQGRPLTWRLYRIPFQTDTLQIGAPNLRQIQAVRMTVVAPDRGVVEEEIHFALARMRLVGAPWVRRAPTPIRGLSGDVGVPHGEVSVLTVSTDNEDLGYESPPGIEDIADRVEAAFQFGSQQVNEKSLRILARDLRAGERAEALLRFTDEADKNFLSYRTLQVWARGRNAGWNEGDLEFYIKVGRDENNFYLYRTSARTDTWEPEVVIDLSRWLDLRAMVEAAWLRGDEPSGFGECGGDSTAFIACDGPYMVHVRDPGVRPPNLAQVSEVAVGLFRSDETLVIDQAELWVDDIRLTDVVNDHGMARAIDARITAADVAEFSVSYRNQDDQFRAPGRAPTYLAQGATELAALVRADRFLPSSWGLSIPVRVRHATSSTDPFFVPRTDLKADRLGEIRKPRSRVTAYEMSIRRSERSSSPVVRALLDPLSARAHHRSIETTASYSTAASTEQEVQVRYENVPGPQTVAIVPGFLLRFVERLPGWLRESAMGRAVRSARLRWNPVRLSFSSTLTKHERDRFAFRVPVSLPEDSVGRSLSGRLNTWRNDAGVTLRPFHSLGLHASISSLRDLQRYRDTTVMSRLLADARGTLIGTDVGYERARTLGTAFDLAPPIASWLRPRLRFTSQFRTSRDPHRRDPLAVNADSTRFRLPETIANARSREVGVTVDLGRLARNLAGDTSTFGRLAGSILPLDLTRRADQRSTFDRVPSSADFGYQLGFGTLEDFQRRDGELATAVGRTVLTVASGGVRLPGGGALRVNRRVQDQIAWAERGDVFGKVRVRVTEWPSLSLDWTVATPRVVSSIVDRITAGAQYREVRSDIEHRPVPSVDPVLTSNASVLFTPTVAFRWVGDVTTTVQYTMGDGESVTSGNVTETERREWSGSARFTFGVPDSFLRLRERIRASIAVGSSRQDVCLLQAGSEDCRVLSDSRRRYFDVRLDTGVSESVRGGLTFSYISNEQRHTATRLSQLVFSIFADVNLFAGQFQ